MSDFPQAAVDFLQKNPDTWRQFRDKYGGLPEGHQPPGAPPEAEQFLAANPDTASAFQDKYGYLPAAPAEPQPEHGAVANALGAIGDVGKNVALLGARSGARLAGGVATLGEVGLQGAETAAHKSRETMSELDRITAEGEQAMLAKARDNPDAFRREMEANGMGSRADAIISRAQAAPPQPVQTESIAPYQPSAGVKGLAAARAKTSEWEQNAVDALSPDVRAGVEMNLVERDADNKLKLGGGVKDPWWWTANVIDLGAQALPGVGVTGAAARTTYGMRFAEKLSELAAQKVPQSIAIAEARTAATQAATRAAVVAGGLTEGGIAGGMDAKQTLDTLNQVDEDTLMQYQPYRALREKGLSHEAARDQIAHDRAFVVALSSAAVVGLTGAPLNNYIAKWVNKIGPAKTRLAAAAEGVALEGGQEFVQEGGEQVVQNTAEQPITGKDTWDGVLENAITGLVLGGVVGGGSGALAGGHGGETHGGTPEGASTKTTAETPPGGPSGGTQIGEPAAAETAVPSGEAAVKPTGTAASEAELPPVQQKFNAAREALIAAKDGGDAATIGDAATEFKQASVDMGAELLRGGQLDAETQQTVAGALQDARQEGFTPAAVVRPKIDEKVQNVNLKIYDDIANALPVDEDKVMPLVAKGLVKITPEGHPVLTPAGRRERKAFQTQAKIKEQAAGEPAKTPAVSSQKTVTAKVNQQVAAAKTSAKTSAPKTVQKAPAFTKNVQSEKVNTKRVRPAKVDVGGKADIAFSVADTDAALRAAYRGEATAEQIKGLAARKMVTRGGKVLPAGRRTYAQIKAEARTAGGTVAAKGIVAAQTGPQEWTVYHDRKAMQVYSGDNAEADAREDAEAASKEADAGKPKKADIAFSVAAQGNEITAQSGGGKMRGEVQRDQKRLQVREAEVPRGERGKGRGVAMAEKLFAEAKQRGLTMVSDTRVSENAARVYEALERRGYTVKRNPANVDRATGELTSKSEFKGVFEVVAGPKAKPKGEYAAAEFNQSNAKEFDAALSAARQAMSPLDRAQVDPLPKNFDGRVYVTADKKAGFAITRDGMLVNLFRHPDADRAGVMDAAMERARNEGAQTLEAFDTYLAKGYIKRGAIEKARYPFDPSQSPPGWDEKTMGRPDYVVMDIGGNKKAAVAAAVKQPGPIFYSRLTQAAHQVTLKKGSAEQWLATLKNTRGVKQEEIEWTGLGEWLKSLDHPATQKEVFSYLNANQLQVSEQIAGVPEPNLDSKYAIPAVLKAVRDAGGGHPQDMLFALTNDGDAYRALTSQFPELAGDENWSETVMDDVFPGHDRSPTRYQKYTLHEGEGGTKYKELVLTLPAEPQMPYGRIEELPNGKFRVDAPGLQVTTWDTRAQAEKEQARLTGLFSKKKGYQSSHFHAAENVLAHVRFDERMTEDGRTLHIAEVQSDWHQQGRRRGYEQKPSPAPVITVKTQTIKEYYDAHPDNFENDSGYKETLEEFIAFRNDRRVAQDLPYDLGPDSKIQVTYRDGEVIKAATEINRADDVVQYETQRRSDQNWHQENAGHLTNRVPDAPFKTTWPELVMKRMIRWASENGFERLTWDTGETNADRYDLSKQVAEVNATKTLEGDYAIEAIDHEDNIVLDDVYKAEQLPDVIGKDLAERIVKEATIEKPKGMRHSVNYSGLDLKVGSEGMHGFYDKMLPKTVEKYVKKWGGKVDVISVEGKPIKYRLGGHSGHWTVMDADTLEVLPGEFKYKEDAMQVMKNKPQTGTPVAAHVLEITPEMRAAAMEGQPLFARQVDDTAGMPIEDVEKAVAGVKKSLGHDIQVVASVENLPRAVRNATMGLPVKGAFYEDPSTGASQLFLVGENLANAEDVQTTAVHEIVGHLGVRGLLGDTYNSVMGTIYRSFPSQVAEVAARNGINTKHADPQTRESLRNLAAEEVIAYATEKTLGKAANAQRTVWGKIVSVVREALRRVGLLKKFTDADLNDLILRARDHVVAQSKHDRAGQARYEGDIRQAAAAAVKSTGNKDLDSFMAKIGGGKKSLKDRYKAVTTNLKDRFLQQAFDHFHGIKRAEDIAGITSSDSGYTSVRLSGASSELTQSMIEYGHPVWNDGAPDVAGGRGLLDIIRPLGDNVNTWLAYLVAKRANRLLGEGRENLFTRNEIAAALDLGRRHPEFEVAAKAYGEFQGKVLDFAQAAGIIDPSTRALWENADYVPFYRLVENGEVKTSATGGTLGRVRNQIRRLTGGKASLGDPLENIVRNWLAMTDAALKAQATRQVVDNLDGTGFVTKHPNALPTQAIVPKTEIKKFLQQNPEVVKAMADVGVDVKELSPRAFEGMQKMLAFKAPTDEDVISVWRNGKREYWRVHDDLLLKGLMGVDAKAWGPMMEIFRYPRRLLTAAVTSTPAFAVRNAWRDMWQTFIQGVPGGARSTIVPGFDTAKGLISQLRMDKTAISMLAGGGSFTHGYARAGDTAGAAKTIRRAVQKGVSGKLLTSPKKLWTAYTHLLNASENASRQAVYNSVLRAGGSRKEALYQSRDLLDFSMRGDNAVMRFIIETVPFFNARIQGLYRLGRGMRQNFLPIALRGMLLTAAALALFARNRDDERYKEMSNDQKDTYWHLFDVFQQGDHWKIPKPFETGAVFGTVPEAIAEAMYSEEPDAAGQAFGLIGHSFANQLDLLPRPQTIWPLLELAMNKNTFTGAPILTQGDLGKLPGEQDNAGVNPTYRMLAHAMPSFAPEALQSPKQLQHLARGYFGTMNDYVLAASDLLARQATGDTNPPAKRADDYPFLRDFRTAGPSRHTKYIDEVYKVADEAEKVYNSVQSLRKAGVEASDARADAIQDSNQSLLDVRKSFTRAAEKISDLRKRQRALQADANIDPQDKREAMDDFQQRINDTAKDVYDLRPGGKLNPRDELKITFSSPSQQQKALRNAGLKTVAELVQQMP